MLSDTLFDAQAEIEQYLRQYPDNYKPMDPAIAKVKIVMHALQMAIDLCPADKQRERAWRIVGAIESLNTTTLEGLIE